jgi:hypothetical protein
MGDMVTKNAPIVIYVYGCKFNVHGAVKNKKRIINSGHMLYINPKGASLPMSCSSNRGRNKVNMEKGSFKPKVSNEKKMKSQNLRSLKRS